MSKAVSIEDEVLRNLRAIPLGLPGAASGTVEDLELPLDFLRRVADRVIQVTFRERWRVVTGSGVEHRPSASLESGPIPEWLTVSSERSAPVGQQWKEHRPHDSAFRAPINVPAHAGGFVARAENSSERPTVLRMQLTGPRYYAGEGDGSSLDVLRQVVSLVEGVIVHVSVEGRHLPGALAVIRTWRPARGVRVAVHPEPLAVSQWARDNAIGGVKVGATGWLTPRWAGRGEEGGIFIPGESSLIEGLSAAGVQVEQSRLLFEGGDVMVVQAGAERVLLLGEAEVHRNVGMKREEAVSALQRELSADRSVVLPAASFHIDLEVTASPSAAHGRPVAFVLDALGAVRLVCRLAAERLLEAGLLPKEGMQICANPNSPLIQLSGVIASVLLQTEVAEGQHDLEFAAQFRIGETDSGVGNLQRIRFASDWLLAELGLGCDAPSHFGAYLRSLRRAERDRAAIARSLRQLGWKVVRVPGISADSVSLNPLNGLWLGRGAERPRFLMPAYGGLFQAVDDAAGAAVMSAGFEVVPIATGETQRRGGGLHCAIGVA